MEIKTTAMILDRSNEAQLKEASMDAHRPKNQAESMDYEESGPTIHSPPVQATNPRIR